MNDGGGVLELLRIEHAGETLRFDFDCDDLAARYLWDRRSLEIGASGGVTDCPLRAVELFLLAFAPLAWCLGTTIRSRYPVARHTLGALHAIGARVANAYGWPVRENAFDVPVVDAERTRAEGCALFLSGGVDSLSAALAVRARLTSVVYVAEFDYLTTPGTRSPCIEAAENARRIGGELGVEFVQVRTTIAHVIRHGALDGCFPGRCSFWLGLQHVNHLALAANAPRRPPAVAYVAGSVQDFHLAYGSRSADPAFVAAYVLTARIELIEAHVARQRKVEKLLDEAPDWVERVRVCYSSGGGACADCAKCQGTALMIFAAGGTIERTPFPPRIVRELARRIDEAQRFPQTRNLQLDIALTGRALAGTRSERLEQLMARVTAEPAWTTASRA